MKNKLLLWLIIFIITIFPVNYIYGATIPAPIIIEILPGNEIFNSPIITGLTAAGTEVLIYIDGEFAGLAEVNDSDTVTDDYYFALPQYLISGEHAISAIARDKTSLVLSSFSPTREYIIPELPAPTLISPNQKTITAHVRPLITGLTPTNTIVHIYIDGQINGNTGFVTDDSGTANFAYRPFLNLSIGDHTITAVTEDSNGRTSQMSQVMTFRIEAPMPTPVLLTPELDQRTTFKKPFIVGLAKNDSRVRIFIDEKLNGEFLVKNHESGVANFAYQPFLDLAPGPHLVYATAIDSRGKESMWSNLTQFTVKQPQISTTAAEEVSTTSGKGGEEKEVGKSDIDDLLLLARLFRTDKSIKLSDRQKLDIEDLLAEDKVNPDISYEDLALLGDLLLGQIENNVDDTVKASDEEELKDLIGTSSQEEAETGGLINEDKEQQSKLRLNLVIFILFLIAVIVWIFWVNRELIKEKREQAENDN